MTINPFISDRNFSSAWSGRQGAVHRKFQLLHTDAPLAVQREEQSGVPVPVARDLNGFRPRVILPDTKKHIHRDAILLEDIMFERDIDAAHVRPVPRGLPASYTRWPQGKSQAGAPAKADASGSLRASI